MFFFHLLLQARHLPTFLPPFSFCYHLTHNFVYILSSFAKDYHFPRKTRNDPPSEKLIQPHYQPLLAWILQLLFFFYSSLLCLFSLLLVLKSLRVVNFIIFVPFLIADRGSPETVVLFFFPVLVKVIAEKNGRRATAILLEVEWLPVEHGVIVQTPEGWKELHGCHISVRWANL